MVSDMSTLATLPIPDQVFVKEYVKTKNATKSYHRIRPHVTSSSAGELGHRKLKKVEIQQAVREELKLEDLQDELRSCLVDAKKQKSVRERRETILAMAKLGGLLIEKHQEVRESELTPEQLAEELCKRNLLNTNV